MDINAELKQLDLKVLMKKFLSSEKENIKLKKKDDKDIILFEKNNFYIYSDVICGIENRKKEKYNVGDIYLFLCLPKSNYTFSYINSIGYKYISILERNKIIKKIEYENYDEEEDQIKVNFFIYDKKSTINLNYYIHIEQDDVIQSKLFVNNNINDIICDIDSENENWGSIKKRKNIEGSTQHQIVNTNKDDINILGIKKNKIKIDENNINEEIDQSSTLNNIQNKTTNILSIKEVNTHNSKQTNESNIGLVSFNNINKIFNGDKIYKSQIFYIKNDCHNITKTIYNKKKKKKKKKLNQNIKYNFIDEDISTIKYDELFYFNYNEINLEENYINDISTNFKFLKKGIGVCSNQFQKRDNIKNDKHNENINEQNDKHNENINDQNGKHILKHYYENNILKNVFFINFNLYSLLNNTYISNLPKDDNIFSNLQILVSNFFEEYIKFVKKNNSINLNDGKSDIIQFELNLSDLEPQINPQNCDKIKYIFENMHNDCFPNSNKEIQKNHISINNLNFIHNTVLPHYLQNSKINYFKYSTASIETLENFNNHDKLIFFHNIINMYIYSLYDQNFYEKNKIYMNFFHNFLNKFSFEKNFVKINTYKQDYFSETETSSTYSEEILNENFEKDKTILSKNVDEVQSTMDYDQSKFYLLENNYIKIKNKMDSKIFEALSENKYNKGNNELIKSAQIKEIKYKNFYDIIGNSSCDFRRIYNFFKQELLDKSNIKNVYINGVKRNIIIDNNNNDDDNNIKQKNHKKILKIIDEIHLTYKRRPLILIESNSTTDNIINRNNIDSFFLHNNLDKPPKSEKQNNINIPTKMNNYDGISIIYNMFNKNIKFLFIENDKIDILSETDWKCVIAVIVKSKNSLKNILNKYPFEISTTLFQPFKTFAFMYNDEIIPSDLLTGSSIDIIRLNRDNRKDDHIGAKKFWTNIEKFILQRRDKNFYKKKKNI
ncbi:conserved Plasmodium protein, unknown function [Plasmodium berghei]|uniref:CDC73 domain-containing protein, putative n=2 Tax=Plasmodium berghei TaxID=5821 RepID=A0A509AQS0_PLABA|nr:CDC73 domain-containing protein, putative [Plasmodium berghei ANKA]CXI81722.1 conserved Plasmodium protein, unknown function [Plasmodium berghei]SCO62070.1 conserved Plasmodium protein, unknown function [Plasmodium berghei]VUC57252.1 CDC73 domain-containing protein, putative [Plasmodium berghei ANKA]|eukprot:XP_034423031.1 CDC73 domain-containing protein, putative [Plasmodium berghei ANKA]